MVDIYSLISRAQKLREETRLDSVSPDRVGTLLEDTLKYINEYQLLASAPSLHKIYASVSAMQSDPAPKSDLTGKALKPGQLVVIVPASQTDATAGDVYRYDGPSGNTSAWTFVAKLGAVPADAELNATSANPVQNKVVTEKLTELSADIYNSFTQKGKAIEDSGKYWNNANADSTELIKLGKFVKGRMFFYSSNAVYRIAFFDAQKKYITSYYGNGSNGFQEVYISDLPQGAVYMCATTYAQYGESSYLLTENISTAINKWGEEVDVLALQTKTLEDSVALFNDELSSVTGNLGKEEKISQKSRISIWGDNVPQKENYYVRLLCDNPFQKHFHIYKGTKSHTELTKLYNAVQFGTWLLIDNDTTKPSLYFYDTGVAEETIDARNYIIEYRTLSSLSQDVEDLKNREVSAESWKGKTIVCFGDSITEFKDYDNNKAYADYIHDLTEAEVINIGIGGTQFRRRVPVVDVPTTTNQAYAALDIVNMVRACCEQDFAKQIAATNYLTSNNLDANDAIIARMQTIDWSKVDVVTIFAGTNDWNNASDSWGAEDSSEDKYTFGAINEIVRMIMTTYPHVVVYWFTPIVRWLTNDAGEKTAETFSDNFKRNNTTLKEFSARIVEVVKKHHLPICDMYNTLGWNQYNFSQFFPDNDSTHPRKGKGTEQIARKMVAFINANRTF